MEMRENKHDSFLLGFLLGGALGAFLLFVLGTKEGKKLAEKIIDRAKEYGDDVGDKLETVKETVKEKGGDLLKEANKTQKAVVEDLKKNKKISGLLQGKFFKKDGKKLSS